MNSPFNFAIGLLALLLISACRKSEPDSGPVSVKNGQVLDAVTQKAIPLAKVFLKRQRVEEQIPGLRTTIASIVYADSQGRFSIDFHVDKGFKYYLDAEAVHYFGEQYPTYLYPGQSYPGKINLRAKGYVRFDLVNEAPRERIGFSISDYPSSLYDTLLNDTSIYVAAPGGKTNTVYWSIADSTGLTEYNDDIFFPRLDTSVYTVKY